MSSDEKKISKEHERRERKRVEHQSSSGAGGEREEECEGEKRGERGGSKRKIAFRLCSVKGEITHLRRFFQATMGSIDQTTGFMSQFST